MRILLAISIGILIAFLVGSVIGTQMVLSSVEKMGLAVSWGMRWHSSWRDIVGLSSSLLPLMAIALALAPLLAECEATEAGYRKELETKENIIKSAIENRRALADDRISVIRKETRNKLKIPEAKWQGEASGWMDKSTRKVALKEREDAEHEAMKKKKGRR